ncbi:hypothetical protein PENTCL1PPCAC_775, partial [Pristionchus entomophagus]
VLLAEAASARYGTLWLVDEPWLLSFVAINGFWFFEHSLYESYRDHFPECTPQILQRRLPSFRPFNNTITLLLFERTMDPLGIL